MILAGKTALITGAARGIGRATAEALAMRDARVAVVDIDGAEAEVVAAGIRARGGKAEAWRCDVAQDADVAALAEAVNAAFGVPDLLINNAFARRFSRGTIDALQLDNWRAAFEVNVLGNVRMLQAMLPAMFKRGSGYIVDTASSLCISPHPNSQAVLPYIASKGAILSMSFGLRYALQERGIDYSVFCPGLTNTLPPGASTTAVGMDTAPPPSHAAGVLLTGVERGDFLICSEEGFEETIVALARNRLDPLARR